MDLSKCSKILSDFVISADLIYKTHAKKVVDQFPVNWRWKGNCIKTTEAKKKKKSKKEDHLNQKKKRKDKSRWK